MKAVLLSALLLSTSAGAADFDLQALTSLRGPSTGGPSSWMSGGFGRFDSGGSGNEASVLADLQLGFDWRPASHLTVHAHGLARAEPSRNGGRRAGLVDAFVQADFGRGRHDFTLRAGQFFPGTSRENVATLWSSPYTLSLSAINSWIANEVRPVGVHGQWQILTSSAVITGAMTLFEGNDTMGALLAWRGWTLGNRLSVDGEVLPLPPLRSLETTFSAQRRDGTLALGRDLDGRPGYAARVRYSLPERFSLQFTRLDNRGDRLLHRGEYAWATHFNHAGADLRAGDTSLAAEWLGGRTTMGPAFMGVDSDFYSTYLLASHRTGRSRLSARYDLFQASDNRPHPVVRHDEHGRAWTLAWLFDVRPHWRAGTEFTQVTGTHWEAIESGRGAGFDGRNYIVELRYSLK